MVQLNNLGGHSKGTLLATDASGTNKEIISNDLDNLISDACHKPLPITISDVGSPDNADRTLTSDEFFGHFFFILTGSPGIPFSLICPASGNHEFGVANDTGQVCTVTAGGAVVTIVDALTKILHSDGTDIKERVSTGQAYDIPFYIPIIKDGALLAQFVAARAFIIPSGAADSKIKANFIGTSGDDDLVLSLRKNGVEFGTATIANLQSNGSFSVASATSFAIGDRVEIVGPDFGSPVVTIGHSAVSLTFKVDI